ncbi:ComEA family DNA-binding protein [Thermodesulfobacteriota bacterium]
MSYVKKNLKYIVVCLSVAFALFAAGNVNAQHEGGLGEKKIHLNIASKDQLMKIEGMTEDIAKAIIDYREKSGFFKKPEDLLNVPGLTQNIYETLDPQIGSEGDLYCIPMETDDEYYEDEDIPLSPSKC